MTKMEDLLDHPPKNGQFYTIAVDGRGGSGKTSLVNDLQNIIPGFIFLNFDDYFEPREGTTEWGYLNKKRLRKEVIEPLRSTNTFIYRPYDWHKEPHITERSITIEKGLCLEGCFSFSFGLDWDWKIWVETPKETCLKRGVARDGAGMTKNRALKAWRDVWQPQEDKYIERVKPLELADIVLNGTVSFKDQLS